MTIGNIEQYSEPGLCSADCLRSALFGFNAPLSPQLGPKTFQLTPHAFQGIYKGSLKGIYTGIRVEGPKTFQLLAPQVLDPSAPNPRTPGKP